MIEEQSTHTRSMPHSCGSTSGATRNSRPTMSATLVATVTSRGTTTRTIVPVHCAHSQSRVGNHCAITGRFTRVENASSTISRSDSSSTRDPAHMSPPSSATAAVGLLLLLAA
eukprot:5676192-Prymnesium_polylepis.1